ncbi:sensor domain-containing protein [Anoxynatronum buryatiense]|uniref:PAS domain S-box-containing protein/diguanylate cyclase (GGDEF) domain-containing protein n=1 Tax=Anoxynatronum buryatiense TaxID=489973 RepID=A0AA45WWS9_9CLOT|nr:EAL domain-containing protein [Anoxynatronum buryatiense]SMP61395.1 PAS domain S-box-containing protein/diguanylate cyclase (GGDEF) domain-containing protein [Anoxynatronum buryatiense]
MDNIPCKGQLHGPAIFFRRGADYRWPIQFLSDNIAQWGYNAHQMADQGWHYDVLVHPDDLEELRNGMDLVMNRQEKQYTLQYRIVTADRSTRRVAEFGTYYQQNGEGSRFEGYLMDITRYEHMENKLQEAEDHIEKLTGSSLAGIYIIQDNHFVYVNERFAHIFGYEPDELMNQPATIIAKPGDEDLMLENIRRRIEGEPGVSRTYRNIHKEGHLVDVEVLGNRIIFRNEPAVIGTVIDLTATGETYRRLKLADTILQHTNEGVAVTDAKGLIQWVNPAFSDITGYSLQEVMGRNPRILKSQRHKPVFYENMWDSLRAEGFWRGEIWNRRKNGEVYPELLTINAIRDEAGITIQYVSVFNDLSDRIKTEELLRHQKYHDSLTGLPNRFLLMDRLSVSISRAYQEKRMLALMFLDVDRFKRINDTLGHVVGDELIQAFSQRLVETLRDGDTVSRVVGDEFVVLLEMVPGDEAAATVANKIIKSLMKPFRIQGHEIHITVSIGIGLYPEDGKDPETLLKNAEVAMFQAKKYGMNNYRLYSTAMNQRARLKLELENEIRIGLEKNEFFLHYQPQVDVLRGVVESAETLMRWQHPEKGLISPAEFIPVAEETGLIIPMGLYTMRRAFQQAREWKVTGCHRMVLSFNLSPTQFQQQDLYEQIRWLLSQTQADPEMLEVEVTESTTMLDPDFAAETLNKLKKLGIRVAMDDFGTGYSSLALLSRLPVDKLKIDRSFVTGIETSQDKQAIVSAMVGMAKRLGMVVVAEGVEKTSERDFLIEIGCDLIQGFLYSKPLPLGDFQEYVKLQRKNKPIEG